MSSQKNRYFIEVQSNDPTPVPRNKETEQRRALAAQFVHIIGDMLREEELDNKVASMAITALGQVQITCEASVMSRIRDQDRMEIASVRQGPQISDYGRYNGLARL